VPQLSTIRSSANFPRRYDAGRDLLQSCSCQAGVLPGLPARQTSAHRRAPCCVFASRRRRQLPLLVE
jgi:hypothetical protein